MFKKNAFFLVLFINMVWVNAQISNFYFLEKKVDTVYYTKSEYVNYNIPAAEGFPIFGGSYKLDEKSKIQLIKKNMINYTNSINIFFQTYTQNVEKISFINAETKDTLLTVPFKKDGFVNFEMAFNNKKLLKKDTLFIKFEINKRDYNSPYVCDLKNFYIAHSEINKKMFVPSIIQNTNYGTTYDSYGIYDYYPSFDKEEDNKGMLYYKLNSSKSEYESVGSLINLLEDKYPFYKTRKIESKYNFDYGSIKDSCDYFFKLNKYIKTKFNDPHFSISTSNCKKKKTTGILIYKIGSKYKVIAVLDENLAKKINIGNTILSIDNMVVRGLGEGKIQELIEKEPGKTTTFRIEENAKSQIDYIHKETYQVPKKFFQQTEFSKINDNIAYLRLKQINKESLDLILNNINDINSSDKIIIDLRNNGGGDFLIGAQILKIFINQSFNYYQLKNRLTNKLENVVVSKTKSTNVINPNVEIRILINEKTACVSELIAYNLKKYINKSVIIGTKSSSGALANLYEILFEEFPNIRIKTNSLSKSLIYLDGKSIEGKGIEPDIKAKIKSFEDLQPFNDKVLSLAISK